MSLGVAVAMRQLQRASKVLANMILFKGKDSVSHLPFSSLSFPHFSVELLIRPFPSYSSLPLSASFTPFPILLILILILSFFSYAGILTPSGLCKAAWGTLIRAIPSLTSLLLNQDPQVRTQTLYVESLYFSLIHGALWLSLYTVYCI
jgi:hypothetical protein